MANLRPGSRSPTHVQFGNENGIVGIAQSFRNKSGCTSGVCLAWEVTNVLPVLIPRQVLSIRYRTIRCSDTSPGAFYPVQNQQMF